MKRVSKRFENPSVLKKVDARTIEHAVEVGEDFMEGLILDDNETRNMKMEQIKLMNATVYGMLKKALEFLDDDDKLWSEMCNATENLYRIIMK